MSTGQMQEGMSAQTAPPPAQPTVIEQLHNHVHQNNDHLTASIANLQGFLSRAVGEVPTGAPQPETAIAQTGLLGNTDEALNSQSRLLNDLREIILVIEKLV